MSHRRTAALTFALALCPGLASAGVSVMLENADGHQTPLKLDHHSGRDVVIDLHNVLRFGHWLRDAEPRRDESFARQVARSKGNFAALLDGIVACANIYEENGYAACDDETAIALYDMMAHSWMSDPDQPAGLRMGDLFGAPIVMRGGVSFYLDVDNPLLAGLGIGALSCHPVINDPSNATCLLEPRPTS